MSNARVATTGRMPLDRQQILTAAVELADESGFGAVTMRSLAARLGVKPMALYHYAANKREIVDGMVDAVFAEIDLPSPELAWRPAMRQRAVSTRSVLARHPWATPLMPARQHPGPATLRHLDCVIAVLRRGGFSVSDTAHAYSLLDSYVYGFVLEESSPFDDVSVLPDPVTALAQLIPRDTYPSLHEFTFAHVLHPDSAFESEFEYGLDLILDSLERLLTDDSAHRT